MDKLTEHDRLNIGTIFNDVLAKKDAELSEVTDQTKKMEDKLSSLQNKYINHLTKKCSKEYDWIKNNTIPVHKDNNISYELKNAATTNSTEKFKQWEDCSSMHDHGISTFFKNLFEQQKSSRKESDSCFVTCVNNLYNEKKEVIYNCFEGCIDNVISDTKSFIAANERKINDFDKKL